MSLSVVVPTSKLVCVLCALNAVSLRLCAAIPYFWIVVCLLCSPGRCAGLLLVAAVMSCTIYHRMSLGIYYIIALSLRVETLVLQTSWLHYTKVSTCTAGSVCLMWVLRCGCFSLFVCTYCLVS